MRTFKQLLLVASLLALLPACVAFPENRVTIANVTDNSIRIFSTAYYPTKDNARTVTNTGVSASIENGTLEADAYIYGASVDFGATVGFVYAQAAADLPSLVHIFSDLKNNALGIITRAYYVFEYDEKNGKAGFQPFADNLTGWYNLTHESVQWEPVKNKKIDVDSDEEVSAFEVIVSTEDEVFSERITGSGRAVYVNDKLIDAGKIKIDLELKYFDNDEYTGASAFATGPSNADEVPNARVGVLMGVLSQKGSDLDADDDDHIIEAYLNGVRGTFTYDKHAFVDMDDDDDDDDTPIDVNTFYTKEFSGFNNTEQLQYRLIFFSFDTIRPKKVYWDPEVAVEATSAAGSLLPALAMLALAAFVALMM